MKDRILKNWNFRRAIYVILGGLMIVQSIESRQWFTVVFGVYFASMGLFAFGCAGGNCFGGNCEVDLDKKNLKTEENGTITKE